MTPFSGGWQTLIDSLRIVTIAVGLVVAVLAARNFANPWKRKFLPPTRPGTLALTFFAISASLTELGRLGHDMGYWRLPINLCGLIAAAVTCWRLAEVSTSTYPDTSSADKHRIHELERLLDEAQEAAMSRDE